MADNEIHACIDRFLPKDMIVEAGERALDENPTNAPIINFPPSPGFGGPSPLEMAVLAAKKWRNGRTLRVTFMDGDPAVKEKVANVAQRWKPHANITFEFGTAADADIRISFEADPGSWSYLGTDALTIDRRRPTMNYGWLTTESEDSEYERVVVHEFGHALGAIHEHQNPVASIPWDKEAVYRYYQGPPNNWTRAQVDNNLFRRYEADQTQFSAFDPQSIMLYPVPNQFTIGDFEIGMNRALSDTDKAFIATLYPGRPKSDSELQVNGPAVQASIGAHGEEDPFRFTVADRRTHTVETSGSTDVMMGLFGPGDDTRLVAADDDSGQGRNAMIARRLAPGTYLVRVRHFNPRGTGEYGISVRAA